MASPSPLLHRYIATTHFEATKARKAFPCFDEPTYRATFDIQLAKLDDQIALSNMPPAAEPSDYEYVCQGRPVLPGFPDPGRLTV